MVDHDRFYNYFIFAINTIHRKNIHTTLILPNFPNLNFIFCQINVRKYWGGIRL